MGSIEIAVQGSKRLESLLESRFGARGRGLHEKLTSVEGRIPRDVRKSIRWVATVRNRVVHEQRPIEFAADDFVRTVERVAQRLSTAGRQKPARSRAKGGRRRQRGASARRPGRVVLLLLLLTAAAAVLVAALR
jgi:hypothetical protein